MDPFTDFPTTLSTPARDAAAITPSDSVDLTVVPRAIYVGVTGSVAAVMAGGQTVMLQNVAAGSLLPIRVGRINATGTTASGLVALW
jgi:hypothetical protein